MHDLGARLDLPLILMLEPYWLKPEIVMPSMELYFSLNKYLWEKFSVNLTVHIVFLVISLVTYGRLVSKSSLPDEKSCWSVAFIPFKTPFVDTLETDITDSFLFISSDGKFSFIIPKITCLINFVVVYMRIIIQC